jgi:N-acetyl-anhydromuramyl-L-alanine amidase AmpD
MVLRSTRRLFGHGADHGFHEAQYQRLFYLCMGITLRWPFI